MARIAYGVHGTGHGHAMRALTLARHYPEHEFLFVSHSDGLSILEPEFRVFELPNPATPVRFHKVDVPALVVENLRVFRKIKKLTRKAVDILERFKPDAVITDYEFFLPRACRVMRLPCLSIDHQHIVTECRHSVPPGQLYSYFSTYCSIKYLFSRASDYIVSSFFQLPAKSNDAVKIVPPLLRDVVLSVKPDLKDHVLAYHGYSTSKDFFRFLEKIPRTVIVYGSDVDNKEKNLIFKKNSEENFLSDLASSRYVVCSGGHSLISEALYYGKPLIVFPIKNAFEQFLNCHYLVKFGYGRYFEKFSVGKSEVHSFEEQLDGYLGNIGEGNFCGNEEIFALFEQFVEKKIFQKSADPKGQK